MSPAPLNKPTRYKSADSEGAVRRQRARHAQGKCRASVSHGAAYRGGWCRRCCSKNYRKLRARYHSNQFVRLRACARAARSLARKHCLAIILWATQDRRDELLEMTYTALARIYA